MLFNFVCSSCPMKFTNEADLQLHTEVHTDGKQATSFYDFDANTEPLFNEFLNAFFPDLKDSYIPSLNDFCPLDLPEEDPSTLSSTDEDATYTTLTTVNFQSDYSEEETESDSSSDSIATPPKNPNKFPGIQPSSKQQANVLLKKLPPTVKLVNVDPFHPVPYQGGLKQVYVARRPPTITRIQHHYGDTRTERYPHYQTGLLKSAILTKCLPGIAKPPNPDLNAQDSPVFGTINPTNKGTKRKRRATIGEKPYTCEVCNKRFAFFKKFIAHKRIHIVGKLYSCYLCHKRFGYSYKLSQHIRMHTGENAERCSSCKKTYKNMTYLRRHRCRGMNAIMARKGVSKSRPYSCTVCKRTFGRINYLNLHKRCHFDKEDPQNPDQVSPMERFQDPWV